MAPSEPPPRPGPAQLLAGTVGAPHGLDGSFRVNQPAANLLRDGGLVSIDGRAHAINRRAGHVGRIILRLAGIDDRDGAEALRGRALMVDRGEVSPLGEDEWWAEDLEGCQVLDGDREVGVVQRLMALPSCEVLEVRRVAGGTLLLVPLVGDAVRTVDVDAKRIDVDLAFLGED